MKRAIMFAAALMAGITMTGSPLAVQAACANTTVVKTVVSADCTTIKDCLEQLGAEQWGNCTVIAIPCIPGVGDNCPVTPDVPDNSEPDENIPETPDVSIPELPDNSEPDESIPETPDNSAPETPDSSAPDTSIPEMPDVSIPETPDNSAPETPDTEQPGQDDASQSVHAYVLRVVELVNEERAKAGLNPLTLDADVTAAAQVRAVETEQSFSHTRPDGSSFSTALKEAGVSYRGAGENIAWGQKTPEQVMDAWMNSAGHRANILNEKFTTIGVGYYQNANGVNYWSQLFTY